MREIRALIGGVWHGRLDETAAVRSALAGARGFRGQVTADGRSGFRAEPGRYHLYVSYACPWAHRTIIYRQLKRLENVVTMSVLHPRWATPEGWRFDDGAMSTVDHVAGRRFLHEVYRAAKPDYTGRVSVPVLWDRATETIVSNESGEIIRMLNSAFDEWGDAAADFYPPALRADIDALNAWLIPTVCAGVYRAGFAATQHAYERAVVALFAALDELERRLSRQPYLLGDQLTESDWHLFATLCRFDAVYHGALRCNLRRLVDYPALTAYARRVHDVPGVAETVKLDHVKRHYYDAIGEIDPTIVPVGPADDYRIIGSGSAHGVGREERAGATDDSFFAEVLDFHRGLERWLKGDVPNRDIAFARLAAALAEDFVVVHPNGRRDGKAGVLRSFASAFGEKPKRYRLEIRDVSLRRYEGGLCLATYVESHGGEAGRTRVSTALLRQRSAGGPVEWLSLQETLLAEAVGHGRIDATSDATVG